MTDVNRQWLLRARPQGHLRLEDFEYREQPAATAPLAEGEVRIRNVVFLCAPTMRNWMDPPGNSFYPSVPLGAPVMAPAVGRVVASNNPEFAVGDRVSSISSWQDFATVAATELRKPTKLPDGVSFIDALGRFGLNPLTAYFGLLEVGQPQAGETLVVSGAAGSTGSTVCQIGKIKGLTVVGIAGGRDKCAWLTGECGIDAAIDYKHENVEARLAELCPTGVDVFFDNVGGDILQAAVNNMAPKGRIVLCGQISSYDADQQPEGPRNMMRLIYGSIRMQGFLCGNYAAEFPRAVADLKAWHDAGKIVYREDLHVGFDQLPDAFMTLFRGANQGTLLVAIDEAEARATS
ncbi:MAG: NADP-dependent oxidoreductase [Gammaproteobacteria bacterium]